MEISKKHLFHILLYEFQKKSSTDEAMRNISRAYGPNTVSKSEAEIWFARFRNNDFSYQDDDPSGSSRMVSLRQLRERGERNSRTKPG
jgi:hypothetical protein